MKNKILLFFLIILCSKFSLHGQNQKTFTAADYDKAVAMLDGNVTQYIDHMIWPQWLPDNRIWYMSRQAEKVTFKLVHPKSGKKIVANTKKELFAKAAVEPMAMQTNVDEVMSPDGRYVAFIKDWNLWMKEITTGEETALTTDGIEHFGYATDNAGWRKSDRPILSWSPDSKKIATFRQDQQHVSNMYLVKTKVGAPELQEWKYPLPGDSMIIQIYRVIIDIEPAPKIIPLKMGPDDRRGTLCDDISCEGGFDDIAWSSDSKQLVFVSTSRDHKLAKVRMANTKTGDVREVFKEEVATQYESGRGAINWRYLSKTNERRILK